MKADETGRYRNVFAELGYTFAEIDNRLKKDVQQLFYGEEHVRIYYPCGNDMGYIMDTGNNDVRTEGMSYGMMICVQMDRKEEFDRLWKWAKTYMYMTEGTHRGYFAWSCALDGKKNSRGPAPDGEEYFALALFFAAHRWGEGEGIFAYEKQAKQLLSDCVHKGEAGDGAYAMWDRENKLIKFVPEAEFTDPSYHLPHFYELFALWAEEEDRRFWKEAAKASRAFLKKACHPLTGMSPEYSAYDGSVLTGDDRYIGRERYYSDAYRTIANIGLDSAWFGKDAWACETANKLQKFFMDTQQGKTDGVFLTDGTVLDEKARHPVAVIATNAQASLAADGKYANACAQLLWDTPCRTGTQRYYDNCLYLFAMLALSGTYRIW